MVDPLSATFSAVVNVAPPSGKDCGGVLRSRVRRMLIHTVAHRSPSPEMSKTLNLNESARYPGCWLVPRTALKSKSSGRSDIACATRATAVEDESAVYVNLPAGQCRNSPRTSSSSVSEDGLDGSAVT